MIKEMPDNGDYVRIKGKVYKITSVESSWGMTYPPQLHVYGFRLRELSQEEIDRERNTISAVLP